jgi:PPOX class probable F420-dependent enzyme
VARITSVSSWLQEDARVGHLATVDARGRPHVVPVCFALVDGRLYTPVDEKPKRGVELRRVRNLRRDPAVCLTVDRYDEDWSRLAWTQLRGAASLVEDEDERREAIAALRSKYPQYRAMDLESRPLIRLDPERIVSWSASG